MDSIPLVVHHRPGADPPDRQRRLPGMRHGRHHAALHQAQLPGEEHRRPAARPARGVLHRDERPAGPGGRRHPQGRPVRQGRLLSGRTRSSTSATGRSSRATPTRSRRRSTLMAQAPSGRSSIPAAASSIPGPEASRAAARAGRADRLPGHLDPDGPRRLSGLRPAVARHARHARHLRGQHGDARLRRDDQHRRALRRPHHRPARRLLARLEEDPRRHRPVLDQQERPGRHRRSSATAPMCSRT